LSIPERRELKSTAMQKVEQFFDYQVEDAPVSFALGYRR